MLLVLTVKKGFTSEASLLCFLWYYWNASQSVSITKISQLKQRKKYLFSFHRCVKEGYWAFLSWIEKVIFPWLVLNKSITNYLPLFFNSNFILVTCNKDEHWAFESTVLWKWSSNWESKRKVFSRPSVKRVMDNLVSMEWSSFRCLYSPPPLPSLMGC